jgi:gamma-glutamyltranspeptidase/glutathione hydrolase
MQAPLAARADMYHLDPAGRFDGSVGWRLVEGGGNHLGWQAVGVPGALAAFALALKRFGTISLAEALAPAIELAEEGFLITERQALMFLSARRRVSTQPTGLAAITTEQGQPYAPGDRLRMPALARTLRRLADAGADDLYHGQAARDLAADAQEHGGLLSEADLAEYAVQGPVAPLTVGYHGVTVHAAPGASGGITMLNTLNVLSGFDLAAHDHDSAAALHLWIEASRLAWKDHFQYLGDPRFVDVPWRGLLAPEYGAERRRLIDPGRAQHMCAAGDPWRYEGRPRPDVSYAPSQPWETSGTTHLTVVDRQRNMVALTNTLVGWAGVVSPRTGIWLNNAMGWFNPEPGHADSIAPGKRGLNNMAPVVLLKGGRPLAALGASGGRQIVGTVAQVVSHLVDRRMSIQAAVTMPKVECSRPEVRLDPRFSERTRAALEAMGHRLAPPGPTGAAAAGILIDRERDELHGGESVVNDGVALGYSTT